MCAAVCQAWPDAIGGALLTPRHAVDFPYTRSELAELLRYARAHDVEKGGHYDAGAAAMILWSHHWLNAATREASETIGSFDVPWGDMPALCEIETDEGCSLEDLMQDLWRIERQVFGYVRHGEVPRRPWP
jgi:hypothetical protein